MKRLVVSVALSVVPLFTSAAHAAATFTTDATAFSTSNPGLAVEDFENAMEASGSEDGFTGPLNSATSNAFFAPGSVIPGFSLATVDPAAPSLYVARDAGGNAGATVSSNFFDGNMNITFAPSVTAIGIDLLPWKGIEDGWTVEVFDTADVSLGTYSTLGPSFVGMTSKTSIGRLLIDKPNTGGVIDNLNFGQAGAVPEPATLALLSAALVAGPFGLCRRPRPLPCCRSLSFLS